VRPMKRIVFCTFELRALLWERGHTERACEVGLQVRSGTGTVTACDLLERLVSGARRLTTAPTARILAHPA
jgi:hypothetical protein